MHGRDTLIKQRLNPTPFWLQMATFIIPWILYGSFCFWQAQAEYGKTTGGEEHDYVVDCLLSSKTE
jgi:hypothetical protein